MVIAKRGLSTMWTNFMPNKLRGELNDGIGDYVSQRQKCTRLKPYAPRTDEDLIPLLCDLLVVTSAQVHERLCFHLDRLTHRTSVKWKKSFVLGGLFAFTVVMSPNVSTTPTSTYGVVGSCTAMVMSKITT